MSSYGPIIENLNIGGCEVTASEVTYIIVVIDTSASIHNRKLEDTIEKSLIELQKKLSVLENSNMIFIQRIDFASKTWFSTVRSVSDMSTYYRAHIDDDGWTALYRSIIDIKEKILDNSESKYNKLVSEGYEVRAAMYIVSDGEDAMPPKGMSLRNSKSANIEESAEALKLFNEKGFITFFYDLGGSNQNVIREKSQNVTDGIEIKVSTSNNGILDKIRNFFAGSKTKLEFDHYYKTDKISVDEVIKVIDEMSESIEKVSQGQISASKSAWLFK